MTVISDRRRLAGLARSRALRFLPATTLLVDVAVLGTSAFLAVRGRERLDVFAPAAFSEGLAIVAPMMVVGWLLLILVWGGYRDSVFGVGTDEYKRVVSASFVTAALVGMGCYLASYPLSRGFFLLTFGIGLPGLVLGRWLVRQALHQARRRGSLLHRVIIVGSPEHVDEVAAVLGREQWLGYRVVGALVPQPGTLEETGTGIPVLGSADEATSIVLGSGVDVVFFAHGAMASSSQMRQIAWDLEHEDVQMIMAPNVTDVSAERVRIRPAGGLPLMHLDAPRATDASRWGKRLFDLVVASVLLVLLLPVFLFVAVAIKAHDRGPIFFRHNRVGRNGEAFGCLKFRTMVVDAEARIADLQRSVGRDPLLFKMKDDPRITGPGHWLRRYSVDELPQLLNVLAGDMSLVGPRPQVEAEVAMYDGVMHRRLRVRPGMTGLWQVSGRNELSPAEAIRLDLYYVDNWSMLQDLHILAKTVNAVLGSRGAY